MGQFSKKLKKKSFYIPRNVIGVLQLPSAYDYDCFTDNKKISDYFVRTSTQASKIMDLIKLQHYEAASPILKNNIKESTAILKANPQLYINHAVFMYKDYSLSALIALNEGDFLSSIRYYVTSMVYECILLVRAINIKNYKDIIKWSKQYCTIYKSINKICGRTIVNDTFEYISFRDLGSLISSNMLSVIDNTQITKKSFIYYYDIIKNLILIHQEIENTILSPKLDAYFNIIYEIPKSNSNMSPDDWEKIKDSIYSIDNIIQTYKSVDSLVEYILNKMEEKNETAGSYLLQ